MTKAVFFGASTVAGDGASAPDRRFTSVAAHALGWEEINLGVGGTAMTGRDDETGLIVDEESGIGRIPDVLQAHPDWVVIQFGANDFAAGMPLGDPAEFQQGTFFWDFDTALRGLIENLPDTQILLLTLLYRRDADTPNAQGLVLEDYNKTIRRLAERYTLMLADAAIHAGIDARSFGALSADDAHLNDDGHQRVAAFLIECLQTDRCD